VTIVTIPDDANQKPPKLAVLKATQVTEGQHKRLKHLEMAGFAIEIEIVNCHLMRKLKMDELGRMSLDEYQAAEKFPVAVVLDNIRSKNNVGSVFRSADAFRIESLVLCGYTPAPPDRDIAKTALGADLSVTWRKEDDALATVRQLKTQGYHVLVLEQTEGSIPLHQFQRESNQKYVLVLGNEVDGVQQAIVDLADHALEIPQFGTKHSLNISVATGIALYQLILHS
jgi:tRNA G18 (ribose-2'-O)-methylase SpoU